MMYFADTVWISEPTYSMIALALYMNQWYDSHIVLMISCDSFLQSHFLQYNRNRAVDSPPLFLGIQFSEDTCKYIERKRQGLFHSVN